jgi:hypothetical protein
MLDLAPPVLRPFIRLDVEIGPVLTVGMGGSGQRRIIPITGGTVSGRLTGQIIGGGADWQTIRHDGVAVLSARYAFKTDDGAIVEILNEGYRHAPHDVAQRVAAGEAVPPNSYYMRTTARLETGHPDHSWINRMVFVGTGAKSAAGVQIELYAVE